MDSERAERIALIRDSAGGVIPADGDVSRVRHLRFTDRDFDRATWAEMAQLGWQMLLVPEEDGGAGFGIEEFGALAEMLGRGLVPEPLLPAIVGAPLLSEDDRGGVLSGDRTLILALDGEARFTDGRVSGRIGGLMAARDADLFLVAADAGLVLVDGKAAGLTVDPVASQDGATLSTLTLADCPATPVAGDVDATRDLLTLGIAAYLLGLSERAFELTLDHLRTRQQFGKAIGSFQALQHRCADLLVQLELTRASVGRAARTFEQAPGSSEARMAVSRAKARAGDAAMLIARDGVQLHGGIGYADESDIGLFLRKAMTMVNQSGAPGWHRKRYAAMLMADNMGAAA